MPSLKLHVYRGTNPGTASCDFRGDSAIGHEQGDEHRTVFEVDPCPAELETIALADGPKVNAIFEAMKAAEPGGFGNVATALGLNGDGPVGLRIGLWDQ